MLSLVMDIYNNGWCEILNQLQIWGFFKKVDFGTSNPMVSGNNAVELVEQVADRVVHMHASDRPRDLHHCIEGTGEVDFAEIFSALQSAGYHGWISLEAAGQDADEIQQGLLYIRKTWEDTG